MKFLKNRDKKIHVILHGGFGNQLFQYLKAKLEQKKNLNSILYLHTSCLKNYKVARAFELDSVISNKDILVSQKKWFCRFRFLKLINRFLNQEIIFQFSSNVIVIDGYYQHLESYSKYTEKEILDVIHEISLKFQPNVKKIKKDRIIHLRLTDFFLDSESAYSYVITYLNEINSKSEIITDDDSLINKAIRYLGKEELLTIVKTSDLSPHKLIHLFSNYQSIYSNGSSLAFWASVINKSNLYTTDDKLSRLHAYFSGMNKRPHNV